MSVEWHATMKGTYVCYEGDIKLEPPHSIGRWVGDALRRWEALVDGIVRDEHHHNTSTEKCNIHCSPFNVKAELISRTKYSRKILIISIADRSIDCLLAGIMAPQIELFAIHIYPHAIYQGTRLIGNLFHTIELQCVKLTHRMKQSWKYHFKETPKRTRNVKIVYC